VGCGLNSPSYRKSTVEYLQNILALVNVATDSERMYSEYRQKERQTERQTVSCRRRRRRAADLRRTRREPRR